MFGLQGKNAAKLAGLSRQEVWNIQLLRHTRPALLAVGMIGLSGAGLTRAGWAQTGASDAQVESNVLKALAGAPELANAAITTRTVYGTVTLSGTVPTEATRQRAENLAANAPGVKKVVDELALGTAGSPGDAQAGTQPVPGSSAGLGPGPNMVLQSDGTYAPAQPGDASAAAANSQTAQPQRNNPDADQALDQQMPAQQPGNGQTVNGQQPSGPYPGYPQAGSYPPQQGYPPQQSGYPQQQGYPQAKNQYPAQPGGYPQYPPQQGSYPGNPGYPVRGVQPGYGPAYAAPMDGGQVGGQSVTIPAGTLVRVRVNQNLSSNHSQPGTAFDGVVLNDVVAGSEIAIPRGATVQGTVVDAKASGVLKGRGEISLALTSVTLGGRNYPIVSDNWAHNGADKTIDTVNRTAGFGALGAIVGAVAGGGEGAAIGAGVGAAAGVGSSAASGRGQVFVPAEAVLTFHLAQPASIVTVSEQEMQRLAYGAGPNRGPQARPLYAPRPYPPPYGYPY